MAYELTFVQSNPGRVYSQTSSPTSSGGSNIHTSNALTLRFLDDDAFLNTVASDATPATLLDDFSLTIRNTTYTYPAGTEVALSPPTVMFLLLDGVRTQVHMQGLLVKVDGNWRPIVNQLNNNYPGLYLFTNAETTSPDYGKPIVREENLTAQSMSMNKVAVPVPYDGQPDPDPGDVECFTPGALIDTPQGPRRVEDLRAGDMVLTRDHGPQPLIWVGRRRLSSAQLADPRLRPIRIAAGALAPGSPSRDLVVSPQHRLLLCSRILARVTGEAEVLTPACQLAGWPGVEVLPAGPQGVTYLHLMCARHEVIRADDAWTETLYPGPELRRRNAGMVTEIARLFPELMAPGSPLPAPARPFLRGKPLREVQRRAEKNRHALVENLI